MKCSAFSTILLLLLDASFTYAKINPSSPNAVDPDLLTFDDEQLRSLFDFEQDDFFLKHTTGGKFLEKMVLIK